MHQQLRGYKVEEKLYVGVREQKTLNTADIHGSFKDAVSALNYIVPTAG
jgi:hypothetical protein